MSRARIDDHDWWLCSVEAIFEASFAVARDTQQGVVDRPFEEPRIDDQFVVEIEQGRLPCPFVRDHVVRTLPQRIPEQDGPLPQVALVSQKVIRSQ
jgi:hypothetical protein